MQEQAVVMPASVRALRVGRSASLRLMTNNILGAFGANSASTILPPTYVTNGYMLLSTALLSTSAVPNRIFLNTDDFFHVMYFAMKFFSSMAVAIIDIDERSVGPVIVSSWWSFLFFGLPVVIAALRLYVKTAERFRDTPNHLLIKSLDGILLAAQLSRIINTIPDILVTVGVDVSYLVHVASVISASVMAAAAKILENRYPLILSIEEVVKSVSWSTYFVALGLNMHDISPYVLSSVAWAVPTYMIEGITVLGMGVGIAKIANDYRKSQQRIEVLDEESQSEEMSGTETKEEGTPIFSKKTSVGCWSRLKARFWSAPSENNSTRSSAQTGLLGETDRTSGSPSLNSEARGYQSGNTGHSSLQKN